MLKLNTNCVDVLTFLNDANEEIRTTPLVSTELTKIAGDINNSTLKFYINIWTEQ